MGTEGRPFPDKVAGSRALGRASARARGDRARRAAAALRAAEDASARLARWRCSSAEPARARASASCLPNGPDWRRRLARRRAHRRGRRPAQHVLQAARARLRAAPRRRPDPADGAALARPTTTSSASRRSRPRSRDARAAAAALPELPYLRRVDRFGDGGRTWARPARGRAAATPRRSTTPCCARVEAQVTPAGSRGDRLQLAAARPIRRARSTATAPWCATRST